MINLGRLVIALVTAITIGVVVVVFLRCHDERSVSVDEAPRVTATDSKSGGEKEMAHLYFADKAHRYLIAEQRMLVKSPDDVEFGRRIIQALIDGPGDSLVRTIPKGTLLRSFYLDKYRMAYVDLSEAVREKHSGGAESELLTIYSIVNSLILNMDEVETVKLLIEGRQIITLAGHIDTQNPFSANMLLIR